MNTRMNLTSLADLANAQLANKGRPLALALDDILPDPNNPRNADDDASEAAIEAQDELDADVAARGVKTPISVRAHSTMPGKYLINYGYRRYKAARRNKLATIPAFIDETFDSYDQINENELRIGLTTRARALFIKGRLDAGESKSEIAERMRKKNQTFVTEHLALIDAPECVNETYAAGVTSARTLYDLRQAWQEFPAAVDAWCRSTPHISRDAIREALATFRHDEADMAVNEGETVMPIQEILLESEKVVPVESAGNPKNLTGNAHDEESYADATSTHEAAACRAKSLGKARTAVQHMSNSAAPAPKTLGNRLVVRYEGRLAWVSLDVVVPIVVEGHDDVVSVRLAELTFAQ
jgi:ParB family chromosome partitioning protein